MRRIECSHAVSKLILSSADRAAFTSPTLEPHGAYRTALSHTGTRCRWLGRKPNPRCGLRRSCRRFCRPSQGQLPSDILMETLFRMLWRCLEVLRISVPGEGIQGCHGGVHPCDGGGDVPATAMDEHEQQQRVRGEGTCSDCDHPDA